MFPEQEFALHIYRLFLPVCTSTFFTFRIAVNIFALHLFIYLFFVLWKNYFALWIAVNIFALHLFIYLFFVLWKNYFAFWIAVNIFGMWKKINLQSKTIMKIHQTCSWKYLDQSKTTHHSNNIDHKFITSQSTSNSKWNCYCVPPLILLTKLL